MKTVRLYEDISKYQCVLEVIDLKPLVGSSYLQDIIEDS